MHNKEEEEYENKELPNLSGVFKQRIDKSANR